jgi:dynein heavy chain
MNMPSGGRNDIPARLKGKFHLLHLLRPSQDSLLHIYGSLIAGFFTAYRGYDPDMLHAAHHLPGITARLWFDVKEHFLPTPEKFHYIFSMCDMTRIFERVVQISPTLMKTDLDLVQLW